MVRDPMNSCTSARKSVALSAMAFFSLILLCTGTAFALDPHKAISQYVHDVWTPDHGLPQNSVQAIIQTCEGYLWFGTQEGLVRFDGVQFTTFDKSVIKEIKDNYITALCEDDKGGLWIGTRGGGLSHLKEGKFSSYITSEGLASNFINSICEDQEGSLWVGTSRGLNRLKNGVFAVYTTKEGLSNDFVQSICEDREGNLWIGTNGGGLNFLKDGKFVTYTTKEGLSSDIVRVVFIDRERRLWIGTDNGLNRLKDGRFTIYTIKEGLSNNTIYSIHEDREGSLWIGTNGGGLNRLKDGRITTFTTKEGLSHDTVNSIYEDREGSLWIGTFAGGLNRLKDGKIHALTMREGLSNDSARSIYEDSKGTIWIGTDGGGLNQFENGKFKNYTTQEGLSNNFVWSILMDRKGSLWVGTDNGLNRMKDGKFTIYTTKDGLSNNIILSICESLDGSLWLGTRNGLNCFKDGEFIIYTTKEGLSNNALRVVFMDREGNLWIGTENGLNRMKDGKFTKYTTEDGLANNFIYSIYENGEGILWIGTRGGLNRLENGKFITYARRDGMFDDVVFQILEDGKENLWMSCNKGIFRVSQKELSDFGEGKTNSIRCVSYGVADGMKSRECNGGVQPAGWKTRDGRLLFPTIKGVAIINPEEEQKINDQPPPVLIEQVFVDEAAISIKSGQEAVLSPSAERFEFHYTGLSFLVPERVKFKFKLEGFDRAWVDAGTRRTAYYTRVPPGRYRFKVIACNNDGVWNEAGASFDFYLKPHFYQRTWFYLMCGLVFVFSGAGVFWLRVSQLKKHEEKLEEQVEERTIELGTANKELQHEITERKKAEQGAQRRAAQAALLYKVGQRVSSKLELPALLSEIVTSIRDAFDYYGVMLLLLDEQEKVLHLQSITGAYVSIFSKDTAVEVGKGMIGCAAASGRIQVSGDVSTDPHFYRWENEKTKSEMALPLKSGEKVIGVLDIQSDNFNAFDETEIASMETLSTQIAGAIENARLYDRAQRELSERKRAEEVIKAALKEKEVLLKEIHHRVKNNMQIISSLLRLQSSHLKDERMIDMFKASQSRIRSMALIHEKLYQSEDLARIDFSDYIEKLTIHIFSMFKTDTRAVNLKLEVKDIHLNINQAIPCGLIINELVSNSLKHAFSEGGTGEICIRMYVEEEKYVLIVKDSGTGFPDGLDFRKTETLGMQIISDLVRQLDGTIELKRDHGTEFIIKF